MQWLGGATQKAENNIRALHLLQQLELEGQEPTHEEQSELALYTGWGDSQVLKCKYSKLREMVSEDEWDALMTSTLNAHYTALPVIRAMWAGILQLGAHKLPSIRILDPSAGIGHFRSAMPEVLRDKARWVEIELDGLTARILHQLHPPIEGECAVFNKGFQEVPLASNQFDLVVSNIPFGNYPVVDRGIKEAFLKASIHDYFFAKAVSLTRPGGVIAFITSRYTMDKKDKRVREWLAQRTDLLAAVRLPDTTFKANAGTEVVTDILFLRKRHELRTGDLPSWVETQEVELDAESVSNEEDGDGKARHNQIYCENPGWLVGQVATKRGMYRSGEYTLRYDDERPIEEVVIEILRSVLPDDGFLEGHSESGEGDIVVETTAPSHAIPIPSNAPLDHRRRLEGLREIYDGAQKLLEMEVAGCSTETIETQREALNSAYHRFVARFGPLTNKLHQKLLGDSPALPFLLALEYDYDPLTNTAKRALIFSESTVRSAAQPDEIQNCQDALLYCLNKTGKVELDQIASLANVTLEQAESDLAGKILWTPGGRWETADQYLSGNILEKLNAAKAMLGVEPRLKATIEALVDAMPKALKPSQIKARLGSGWIPAKYIEEFIADILPGVKAQVTHLPQLGSWKLSVQNKWYVPAENTTRWGTERKGALELIEIGLNAGTPVVHDVIEDKRVLNRDATLAAQAKLEELKAHFETWLWQDSERADHLAQIYNTRFNVFARPRHDGSHLTFPGLSKFLIPRPLQKDAVWYALQSQAALVGDEVGLGKTLTAILSIKEAVRLGMAHKALIVVPNHLTEQWRDAFLLAYPNAKILCAGKDDFKKSKRGEFLSRIATGRWDAVIVPQSSFKLLPVSADVLNRFIEGEMDELKAFLQELKAEAGYDRRAEKEIIKAIKRFEAKLVTKSEMDKDSLETITWERLGVDLLVVDELHCLPYESRVLTNLGELPIGEIVEKRLSVLVQSMDPSTQEIKWMPVADWFKNPQSAPMVRIIHKKGVLECTANHKIWTEEEGYVEAGKLTPQHTLKNMPSLQEGICAEHERKSGAKANSLFQRMSKKTPSQDHNKTLSPMRGGVHIPFIRENQQRQTSFLRNFVRCKMAHGAAGANRTCKGIPPARLGCCSSGKHRKAFTGNIGSHEGEQSNSKRRCQKENISEEFWANISCQRRKRKIDSATRSSCKCFESANGIPHSNKTGKRPVQIPTELLQSGCSRPISEISNRDRWSFPQYEEMEILGQTEDRSAKRSRVVSVTFLESESGFRSSISTERNKKVYCLEVAETHNFFAEGVLVSNCYKNLYFHTKMTRIAGLPNANSQRAFDMFVKVRNLLENGGRFIGLTGTPITNTMAEAFTMQRYFQYDTLHDLGLAHFDSWAQMFADTVMLPEMTPDGGGFRVNTRLARFTNIPELSAMLSQFMIMRRWNQVSGEVERPALYSGKPVTVSLPGSPQLKEFVQELAERAEAVRGGHVDPRADNMLKIVRR
jgi:N12 class adenine-specific DNA methylase